MILDVLSHTRQMNNNIFHVGLKVKGSAGSFLHF